MNDVWWEAAGFSDVVTKTGDSFRDRKTVFFEAVDDRGAAFAEGVYALALKGAERHSHDARSITAAVGQLTRRDDLPTTHYMGVLKEHFEKKGLAECAYELAAYAQHEYSEIRKVAEELLEEVVDSITQDHTPTTLPDHLKLCYLWFMRGAPEEGNVFTAFRERLRKWEEDNRE